MSIFISPAQMEACSRVVEDGGLPISQVFVYCMPDGSEVSVDHRGVRTIRYSPDQRRFPDDHINNVLSDHTFTHEV